MPRWDSRRPAAPSATGGRASSFHEDDLHRLFVPPEQIAELIQLDPAQSHHLEVVLRLGPGAELEIFDGRGARWPARIESPGVLRLGRRADPDRGAADVWLAQALAKVRQSDQYRVYDSEVDFIGKVEERNARRLCSESVIKAGR